MGFTLDVPEGVVVERPPGDDARLRAIERRASGKVAGELDVAVFWPSLIADRDGVLCDTLHRAGEALLAPPRVGYGGGVFEMLLPAGPTWRLDTLLERDEAGRPALPYQTVLAIGHPDLRIGAALFITMRAAADPWPAGTEMLESLRFAGRPAATAWRPDEYGLALTY